MFSWKKDLTQATLLFKNKFIEYPKSPFVFWFTIHAGDSETFFTPTSRTRDCSASGWTSDENNSCSVVAAIFLAYKKYTHFLRTQQNDKENINNYITQQ